MSRRNATLIKAGNVHTMDHSSSSGGPYGIWIEDGVITAIAAWGEFGERPQARVLDFAQATIIPGLIDAHTHVAHVGDQNERWSDTIASELPATTAFKAAMNAARHVSNGVTTIRDLGANDWVDVSLKEAVSSDWIIGPRVLAAGHGLTAPGGHMDPRRHVRPGIAANQLASIGVPVTGPNEARQAAWEQIMRGADVIKVNATLSEYVRGRGKLCSPELDLDCLTVVCDLAHAMDRRVAAHCHGGSGVTNALKAGVDTLEHGRFLDDAHLQEMAHQGTYLVPTLSPEARRSARGSTPQDTAEDHWFQEAEAVMYETVRRAAEAGVKIVAGTDAGMPMVPHGTVSFEVAQLAQAGLSNEQALAAATSTAADALGLGDQVGRIKEGYIADLLALQWDPLSDLSILQSSEALRAVFQAGVRLA